MGSRGPSGRTHAADDVSPLHPIPGPHRGDAFPHRSHDPGYLAARRKWERRLDLILSLDQQTIEEMAPRGTDLDEEKASKTNDASEEPLKNANSDIDIALAHSELALMDAQIAA